MTVQKKPHTATVRRIGRQSNGKGGWTEALADVAEVDGQLQPGGAGEETVADQERAKAAWEYLCDPGSNVRRDDELVVGLRRFTVLDVVAFEFGSHLDYLRCDLEEIQRGR